jgi:ubiquinol-cytochrome c reductase cytochrome b subunit
MSLIKSHIFIYSCPSNLKYLWNIGFLLCLILVLQVVLGVLLAIFYTSDIQYSFYTVIYISRDLYLGWYLRYGHSIGSCLVFVASFIHILRGLISISYMYNINLYTSGYLIFILLLLIAFLGYVLAWGQMSFWGAIVITNVFIFIPCLVELICGGFYVSNPTLYRFFILHFILSYVLFGIILLHCYYLHSHMSSSVVNLLINSIIVFYPYMVNKDIFLYHAMALGNLSQLFMHVFGCSQTDNNIEVKTLVTPRHIQPEWYFLIIFCILKVYPHKLIGFIMTGLSITIIL